jgi:hypothetical protein
MSVTVYSIRGDITPNSIVDCGMVFPQKVGLMRSFLEFRAMRDEWKTLQCTKAGEDPLGAFAGFDLVGGVPVVFQEVLAKPDIACFLESDGELLPITVDGRDAFALNVTRTVDACDRTKSPMDETPSGEPMTYWPVFKNSVVGGISGFFRIRESKILLFLAEPADGTGFYAAYKKHGLTGLMFEEQPISES